MSARPTPETDANASPHIGFYSCATVPAEFARRLERGRDEARESLELYKAANSDVKRIARERDEARDAAEKAKSYKRVLKDDNAKLRRELDKAQKDADTFLENFGKIQERAINAERELDELNKRLIEASQRGVDLLIEREDLRTKLDDALAFNMRASRDASLYASMLHEKLDAERALADRLAQFIDLITDALGPYQYLNGTLIVRDAYHTLAAWKEARK